MQTLPFNPMRARRQRNLCCEIRSSRQHPHTYFIVHHGGTTVAYHCDRVPCRSPSCHRGTTRCSCGTRPCLSCPGPRPLSPRSPRSPCLNARSRRSSGSRWRLGCPSTPSVAGPRHPFHCDCSRPLLRRQPHCAGRPARARSLGCWLSLRTALPLWCRPCPRPGDCCLPRQRASARPLGLGGLRGARRGGPPLRSSQGCLLPPARASGPTPGVAVGRSPRPHPRCVRHGCLRPPSRASHPPLPVASGHGPRAYPRGLRRGCPGPPSGAS